VAVANSDPQRSQKIRDAAWALTGASRLSKRVDISTRICELQAEKRDQVLAESRAAVDRHHVTREYVISGLRSHRRLFDRDDPGIEQARHCCGETMAETAAANRALELLGKEIGMFVERQELLTSHTAPATASPSAQPARCSRPATRSWDSRARVRSPA
jgi:hypothetical protein